MPTRHRHFACCPSARQRRRTPGHWPGRSSQGPTPGPGFSRPHVCGAWSSPGEGCPPTRHCPSQSGSLDGPRLFLEGLQGCLRKEWLRGAPSLGLASRPRPRHSRGQMCGPDVTPRESRGPGPAALTGGDPAPPALCSLLSTEEAERCWPLLLCIWQDTLPRSRAPLPPRRPRGQPVTQISILRAAPGARSLHVPRDGPCWNGDSGHQPGHRPGLSSSPLAVGWLCDFGQLPHPL